MFRFYIDCCSESILLSHKELLDSGVCNVVIVSTPNKTHYEILMDIINYKPPQIPTCFGGEASLHHGCTLQTGSKPLTTVFFLTIVPCVNEIIEHRGVVREIIFNL